MSMLHGGFGASGSYTIANSVRLRASASASFSRTPGVAGNSKLLCGRFRIKRGTLGTLQVIASAGTASIDRFYFDSSDRLCLDVLGTTRLVTTAVYRDPSAHYVDVGFQLDVANGTAALRAKILINGTEVGSYSTDTRSSITNTNTNWNAAVVHYIGKDNAGNYFDGVLSEPSLVDGSTSIAYSTTDTNGVPIPSQPSATWGTCGSYLKFNDGTSATTLGYDRSGNGNNWTASGISTTAGVTYDWLTDTPTNNYATLNPLGLCYQGSMSNSIKDACLRMVGSSAAYYLTVPTFPIPTTGSWVCEAKATNAANALSIGIVQSHAAPSFGSYVGYDNAGFRNSYGWQQNGAIYQGPAATNVGTWATFTAGDVITLAYNASTGTFSAFKNGSSAGTAISSLSGEWWFAFAGYSTNGEWSVNFGQQPWSSYTTTLLGGTLAGFKALCTANRTYAAPTTSGSFTGNANADGPCVWLGGAPSTMTINGNAVTWGTHADKIAGGFKVRTASASYNASGSNTFSVSVSGNPFGDSTHTPNTAQGNP